MTETAPPDSESYEVAAGIEPTTLTCVVCATDYELPDTAQCPHREGTICSLRCSLDADCHDVCTRGPVALGMPAVRS